MKSLPPPVTYGWGVYFLWKLGRAKKVSKKKKDTKKSLGKAKKCLVGKKGQKKIKKAAAFWSQPCLQGNITYFTVRIVSYKTTFCYKDSISSTGMQVFFFFFRKTQCFANWKKKLVETEGGGRNGVWNLCSKLCCCFFSLGQGLQRLRQLRYRASIFPPKIPRNTW